MWQSEVIKGWRMEGRKEGRMEGEAKGRQKSLRQILLLRFGPTLPADLDQRIEQTTDLDVLSRWLHSALTAPSLDAFRASLATPAS